MTVADAQRACEAHHSKILFKTSRPRRPRVRRAQPEETTLIQFLAARGLDPNDRLIGDVRAAIGRRNKRIPGFGYLIRDSGLSLDRAREAAVEAGYLYDLGAIGNAPAQTRVTDLLDAIDCELRGMPAYRYDRLPDMTRAERERMEDEERYHFDGGGDAEAPQLIADGPLAGLPDSPILHMPLDQLFLLLRMPCRLEVMT